MEDIYNVLKLSLYIPSFIPPPDMTDMTEVCMAGVACEVENAFYSGTPDSTSFIFSVE